VGFSEKIFSERLRQLRKEAGLTGAQLASKVDVQSSFIALLERQNRKPSIDVFCALAVALGASLDYLAGLDDTPPPPPEPGPSKWITRLIPDLESLDRAGQQAVKALVLGLKKTKRG
jgi:transcriptional regulator with XRE-family HTH domain